ncbi:Nufip1 [Symbiodinium natans]|uniref:Nufip1 protein n=1 Tax=Symbiodinium natans TaxID=878477 RepID=A0A812T3T2_9DINO|nr:Nufip1 [Symbiodinium natans]
MPERSRQEVPLQSGAPSRSRNSHRAPERGSVQPANRTKQSNRLPDPPPAPPLPPASKPSRAPLAPPPPPAPPAPPAPPSLPSKASRDSRAWGEHPLPSRRSRSDSRERDSRAAPPAPPPVPGRRWYEDTTGTTGSSNRYLPEPPRVPDSRPQRPPSPKSDVWDSWHSEYGDGYDSRYDYWDVPDRRYHGRFDICSRSSEESEDEGDEPWADIPQPPCVPYNLPPPPQVPQGWSGKGSSKNMSRKRAAFFPSQWFCHVCNKDFWNQEKYNNHVDDEHIPCPEDGCNFSGPEHVMMVHKLKHVKAADGSNVTDSPEELTAWREMRKANFPSRGNLQKKMELEEKRRLSGALPDPPKLSMLEKLLRRTHGMHGMEKGKGKGKGKKGKFKGKGKEYKGKEFKGDGKSKGKKGKGKAKGKGKRMTWSMSMSEEPVEEKVHPTQFLCLPSVVANCVPLESPFGSSHCQGRSQAYESRNGKLGICRYFERGFCYHGAACLYEHIGGPPQVQASDIATTAWWVLPSTLANRAGRPGEGPAGGVFGPLRARQVRATHVEPYRAPDDRERRDGLLRRLLQPDVDRYYSAILQCVRYIVATDFLQLERPKLPSNVPSLPIQQASVTSETIKVPEASADLGAEMDDSE